MTTSTYRVTYGKEAALRFLGHLDTARLWQRTLRRAALPLAYTQGYHPRPRVATGPPLSLGFMSRTELLDVTLAGAPDPEEVHARLTPVVGPGIRVLSVQRVTPDTPRISAIETLRYIATLTTDPPCTRTALAARAHALLAADSLPVQRTRKGKDKTFDVRSSLRALHVAGEPPHIEMTLAVTPQGTANPREVLALFGVWSDHAIHEASITRTALTFASPNTQGIHGNTTPDDQETHTQAQD